jgi:2-phospho-L-lactate guanylyltransferase
METVAAIPVKPFDQAKRRLSDVLSPGRRRELGEQLARRTVDVCGRAGARPLVLSADDEVTEWARTHGIDVLLDEGSSLDEAAAAAQEWVLERGAAWMICHADLPTLQARHLVPVIDHLSNGGAAIAPSSDGGTSLLGASIRVATAYGPGSFHRHLHRLATCDVRVFTGIRVALDLDTATDLAAALRHPWGAWIADDHSPD